jgi:hypothetical protein
VGCIASGLILAYPSDRNVWLPLWIYQLAAFDVLLAGARDGVLVAILMSKCFRVHERAEGST